MSGNEELIQFSSAAVCNLSAGNEKKNELNFNLLI